MSTQISSNIRFQLESGHFPIGFRLETNWIDRWGLFINQFSAHYDAKKAFFMQSRADYRNEI